jgi:hypothetical protein
VTDMDIDTARILIVPAPPTAGASRSYLMPAGTVFENDIPGTTSGGCFQDQSR